MEHIVGEAGAKPIEIAELVRKALDADKKGGLDAMLRYIVESFQAYGCILWELAPGSDLEAEPPDGRLFVLASHIPTEDFCAIHDLSVQGSYSGRVILRWESLIDNNFTASELQERVFSFLKHCSAILSIPIRLKDDSKAALSLYRKTGEEFSEGDRLKIEQLSEIMPLLYQAIRDRINSELVGNVDKVLHDAEVKSRGILLTFLEKKTVFKEICDCVARTLHCHEASLFLYDCQEVSLYMNGKSLETVKYELMATTLSRAILKNVYQGQQEDGLTSWVLTEGKPAWIFNLNEFREDLDWIGRVYPGLRWENTLADKPLLEQNPITQKGKSPRCVLAVPISIGDKVLGCIRCSRAKGPYYFSGRDLDLLKLVAALVAQCWSTWLGRREMDTENKSWIKLVTSINQLNDYVQNALDAGEPDEARIYNEALRHLDKIIPEADLNSVRLVDPSTKELYFVAMGGKKFDEKDRARIREYRSMTEGETPPSAAARVLLTREPYLIEDCSTEPYHQTLFPNAKRKIIAPIKDRRDVLGVLDIRSVGENPFPKHAVVVADLIGRQLGLYHRLATTIVQLRRDQRQEIQTWADISHQLKGPINQAKRRADLALEEKGSEISHLNAVRGLCRKAKRVVNSLNLLAELASEQPIPLNRVSLDYHSLVKMLIEASQDTELLIDPRRNIRFWVHSQSFRRTQLDRVEVDFDLLEQAITNILDNAGKYSFKNTVVDIFGGLTKRGLFQITVRNEGLKIRSQELKDCVTRLWRGEEAKVTTQEGSGIGLWIVDHIMKAHRGELLIMPTTSDNMTEVKLIFPILGVSRVP